MKIPSNRTLITRDLFVLSGLNILILSENFYYLYVSANLVASAYFTNKNVIF